MINSDLAHKSKNFKKNLKKRLHYIYVYSTIYTQPRDTGYKPKTLTRPHHSAGAEKGNKL